MIIFPFFRGVLAISPEGTRSKTGLLNEFKKGPFYMQEQLGCDIVPIVILGKSDFQDRLIIQQFSIFHLFG